MSLRGCWQKCTSQKYARTLVVSERRRRFLLITVFFSFWWAVSALSASARSELWISLSTFCQSHLIWRYFIFSCPFCSPCLVEWNECQMLCPRNSTHSLHILFYSICFRTKRGPRHHTNIGHRAIGKAQMQFAKPDWITLIYFELKTLSAKWNFFVTECLHGTSDVMSSFCMFK